MNSSKGRRGPIPALFDHNDTITDDADKAAAFNRYFYSVFTKEDMTQFSNLKSSVKFLPSLIDCVDFSSEVVRDYLCNINPSKVCGPDLLPGFLLKHCAQFFAFPLAYLFNFSMCTSTLPRD